MYKTRMEKKTDKGDIKWRNSDVETAESQILVFVELLFPWLCTTFISVLITETISREFVSNGKT